MNQNIIAAADAIATAFNELKKEAVLFELTGENKFTHPVPNPKFDKAAWNEFTDALKYRHKLEAFYRQGSEDVLVCAYGYLSDAPEITAEDVQRAVEQNKISEEIAADQFAQFMGRMKRS